MIHRAQFPALAVFAASVSLSVLVAAQDTPARAFVQASRASLRSQPAATAPVVDFLPTNTEVDVRERGREWCRVRIRNGGTDGFVACRLLGVSAVTIEAIDEALTKFDFSNRDAVDWASKGFWVAPSLSRLVQVGLRMQSAPLAAGLESRPRSAEFDAMKRRLDQGVVVGRTGTHERYVPEPLAAAMKRASLPAARSSFFVAGEMVHPIALRPFTVRSSIDFIPEVVDALSAVHQVPFRTRRWQPAERGNDGLTGVWDIGRVEVIFDREVAIHGVTAGGAATGFVLSSLATPIGDHACSAEESANIRGRAVNTAWRSAIVGWTGKAPLSAPAVVTARQVGGKDQYDKLVIEAVDLDNDGSADFSLWGGLQRAEVSTDTFWKAVFVNIGGKWSLLAFNQQADCT